MICQAHMTMTGTNVPARIEGQLDGKPVSYLLMPHEKMRVTFDAVEDPIWKQYAFTYRTTYVLEDGRVLGAFVEKCLIPPDMIADARAQAQASPSGNGWLYEGEKE